MEMNKELNGVEKLQTIIKGITEFLDKL